MVTNYVKNKLAGLQHCGNQAQAYGVAFAIRLVLFCPHFGKVVV
jgi:hypothetical protein